MNRGMWPKQLSSATEPFAVVQLLTKEQPTDLALSTPRNKIRLLLVYHANTSFLQGGILVMFIV